MALPSFHETFGNLFEIIQRGRNDGQSGSESDSLYQHIHNLDDYLDLPSGDSDIPLLPLTPSESDALSVTSESHGQSEEKNLTDWQDCSEKDENGIPQEDVCGDVLGKFSENLVSQISELSISSSPTQFYLPNLVNCSSPAHSLNSIENERKRECEDVRGKQKCESDKLRCNSQSQGIDDDKSAISPNSMGDMEPKLKEIFKIKSKLEQNNNIWEKCRGCDSNDIFEDVETVMDILGIEKVNNSPEKAITVFSKDAVPIEEKTEIYKSTKVKRENSLLLLPRGISKIDNNLGISEKHLDSFCNNDISLCSPVTGTSCRPCQSISIKIEERNKFILQNDRNPSVDACSLPNLSSPPLKSYNRIEKENEIISDCENDIDCLENLPIDELLDICKMENSESYLSRAKQESEFLSKHFVHTVETVKTHQLDYKDYSSWTLHNSASPLNQASDTKETAADNEGDSSQGLVDSVSGKEPPLDVAAPDSTTDLEEISATNMPAKSLAEFPASESRHNSAARVKSAKGTGYVDLNKVTSTDEHHEICSNPGGKISENKSSIISEKETKPIFKCEECGKFYSNSKSLSKHKVIHSAFRCDNCGRRFKMEETWQKHVNILTCKTKVRRVPKVANLDKSCLESSKKQESKLPSKKNENLVVETSAVATSVKEPFYCVTCGKTYKTKRSLNRHMTRSIGCRKVASEGDTRLVSPKINFDNNSCNLENPNELSHSRELPVNNSLDAIGNLDISASQGFAESGRTTKLASNIDDNLKSLPSKVSSVPEISEGKPSTKCGKESEPDFKKTKGSNNKDVIPEHIFACNSNTFESGGIADSEGNPKLTSDIVGKNSNSSSSKLCDLEPQIGEEMSHTKYFKHVEFESPKMNSSKTISDRGFGCNSEISESGGIANSVGGSLSSLFPTMESVINEQMSNAKYCGDSEFSSTKFGGANLSDSIDANDEGIILPKNNSKKPIEPKHALNHKTCIKNCNKLFAVKAGNESLKVFDGCEKIPNLEESLSRESCSPSTSSHALIGTKSCGSLEFHGQSNRENRSNKLLESQREIVDSSVGSCLENLEERSAVTSSSATHQSILDSVEMSSKCEVKSNCEGSFPSERLLPQKEGVLDLSQDPKIPSIGLISKSNAYENLGGECATLETDGNSLSNVQKERFSRESIDVQENGETPVNLVKSNAKNRCHGIGYSILIPNAGSQKCAINKKPAKGRKGFTSLHPFDNSRSGSILETSLTNNSLDKFESISSVSDIQGISDSLDRSRLPLNVEGRNFPPEVSDLRSEMNEEKISKKSFDGFSINSTRYDKKDQHHCADDMSSTQVLCGNESSSDLNLRNVPYSENVLDSCNEGFANNFNSKNSAFVNNVNITEETKIVKEFVMLEKLKPRFPLNESETENYSTIKIHKNRSVESLGNTSPEYLPSFITNFNASSTDSSSLEILRSQSGLLSKSLLPEQIKLLEEKHYVPEVIWKDKKRCPSKGLSKTTRSVLLSNQKIHPLGVLVSESISNNLKRENVASKRKRCCNSSPKRKKSLLLRENQQDVVKENGETEPINLSHKNSCHSLGDSILIPKSGSRKLGNKKPPAKGLKRVKCSLPSANSRPKSMTKTSLTSNSLKKFESIVSGNLGLTDSLGSSMQTLDVECKNDPPEVSDLRSVMIEEKLGKKSFDILSNNMAGNDEKGQKHCIDSNPNGMQVLSPSDLSDGVKPIYVPCSENVLRKRRHNSSSKGKSSLLLRENQPDVVEGGEKIFMEFETRNNHRTLVQTKRRKMRSKDQDDPNEGKPTNLSNKKRLKSLNISKGLKLQASSQKRCKTTTTRLKKESLTNKMDHLSESLGKVRRNLSEDSCAKLNDMISTKIAKRCQNIASESSHLVTDKLEVRIYLERCEQKLNAKLLDECYPFESDAIKPNVSENRGESFIVENDSLAVEEKVESCKKLISVSDTKSSAKKKNQSTCKSSKAKSANICEVSNPEEMLWPCDKCEKIYKHKQSLLRHKNQCHSY